MDYGWPVRLGYAKPVVKENKYTMSNFDPSKYVNPIWSAGMNAIASTGITLYNASRYPDFGNELF